jgi:protein SCO1/2
MTNRKKQKSFQKSKLILPIIIFAVLFLVIGIGTSYFKKSLYTVMKVPDFALTDQNSKKITNKDMLGKVYLVEFFYSRCPTICPVMNSNMKYIDEQITNPDFGIISISIDPTNDTPEVLKNHAKMIGADSPNWHFLSGNRDYIGNLADMFDIYVGDKEDDSESLNHSGMIALVDKEGNLRCRFDENNMPILYYSGLNYEDEAGTKTSLRGKYHPDREKLIEDIRKLLK